MSWHVNRIDSKFVTACLGFVEGMAEEEVVDNDPDSLDFLNPPAPLVVNRLWPTDSWRRMNDAEVSAVESVMMTLPSRIQRIFNAATEYRSDDDHLAVAGADRDRPFRRRESRGDFGPFGLTEEQADMV